MSGIVIVVFRIKIVVKFKFVYFFGIRYMYLVIVLMIDCFVFIGGCDGVLGVLGVEMIGEKFVGMMFYVLILIIGD